MYVRAFEPGDVAWAEVLLGGMAGRMQARRGELIDVLDGSGFVALDERANPVGVLTYASRRAGVELMYLETTQRHAGVGTTLLDALFRLVGDQNVWLVTTNDNVDALRFYQRRGFVIRALRPGAVDEARNTVKPSIGLVGEYGIPLRDEIELERVMPTP
ncbi:MAG TPA: GNAT family N-acetyltransferase [Acidimicrobiales bacterium]|nr:GNAT family N-acetyltransferase [Acidimicrobiales bacterium]